MPTPEKEVLPEVKILYFLLRILDFMYDIYYMEESSSSLCQCRIYVLK